MIYYIGKGQDKFESATMLDVINFCERNDILAVDTETSDLHPQLGKLLLVQIGNFEDQYVINAKEHDITLLKEVLENKTLVFHNSKFDLRWFNKIGIYPYLYVKDTFLAESILITDKKARRSYAVCCKKYLDVAISKDERNLFKKEIINEKTIEYAARDVKYLLPLYEKQCELITQNDLQECFDLECLFAPVMAYIEDCGMFLNQKRWEEKVERDTAKLNSALDKLDSLYFKYQKNIQTNLFGNSSMNWASPQQVIRFFNEQGLYPVDKHGKPSCRKDVLSRFSDQHEIVKPYLEFKKHAKNVSMYGYSFLNLCNMFPDKRIRTSFNQILKTGRTGSGSSSESSAKEANLQNIPSADETRHCFIPEDGYVYITGDYTQQEQNILANFSLNPSLLEFFRGGSNDMHSFVARKMYSYLSDKTDEEISTKFKKERNSAKTCAFASNYGGTGYTIANNMGIPKEEGDRIYESYMSSFPGLMDYFDIKERETIRLGYILTNNVTKRRIYMSEIDELRELDKQIDWDDYRGHKESETPRYFEYYKPLMVRRSKIKGTIRRTAMNAPIQSTGADMMKRAGILFFHWIIKNNFIKKVKIVNLVHDEYVNECLEELRKLIKDKLEEFMRAAAFEFCKTILIKLEAKESLVWSH